MRPPSATRRLLDDATPTGIAAYPVPSAIDVVDALPVSAAGKVLKRELRKPYWAGQERAVH